MNEIQKQIEQAFIDFKRKVEVICGKELTVNASIHNAPLTIFTENASINRSFSETDMVMRSYKTERFANLDVTIFSVNESKKFKEVTE
jgi:hypothetical protein